MQRIKVDEPFIIHGVERRIRALVLSSHANVNNNYGSLGIQGVHPHVGMK
jgi:hypothetical protein